MSHEEDLRAELRRAVSADAPGIVVDLTECEFIDSSGVRALLLSREAQNGEDADRLAVATSSDQILRILSVMGLDKVIPIRPTVEEAAAALSD
jgi:anti-sigma B factor antagonist